MLVLYLYSQTFKSIDMAVNSFFSTIPFHKNVTFFSLMKHCRQASSMTYWVVKKSPAFCNLELAP